MSQQLNAVVDIEQGNAVVDIEQRTAVVDIKQLNAVVDTLTENNKCYAKFSNYGVKFLNC